MINDIRKYIKNHNFELIGISDLAIYCDASVGNVYTSLVQMQNELTIIKKYLCPQLHHIKEIVDKNEFYCEKCNLKYCNEKLQIGVYITRKTRD